MNETDTDQRSKVIDLSLEFSNLQTASQDQIREGLNAAYERHQLLHEEITNLQKNDAADMLEIARLKKSKLAMKDLIAKLKTGLVPDIIA